MGPSGPEAASSAVNSYVSFSIKPAAFQARSGAYMFIKSKDLGMNSK